MDVTGAVFNEDLAGHARRSHETPYRADIDGLRAVAIGLVILFHGFPDAASGGFVGVDVFFVISGFLISANIFRTLDAGSFGFRDFYARRVRRIFPALAVVLAATLGYGFVVLLPRELALLGQNVAGGAVFGSNLLLWHEAGYFDQAAIYKPLLHLWSLGVEEQFYIVWPLALWFLHRRGWARLPFLIGAGAASFGLSLFVVAHGRTADFYSPLTRLWELDAGAALALLSMTAADKVDGGWRERRIGGVAAADWTSLGGLGLILLGGFGFDRAMAFPGWLAALPVGGSALLIAAGPSALVNRRLLANRAAVFVGMISYPLYLWHWPLISYAHVIDHGRTLKAGLVAALVAASVGLAWITYRFVERPLRFGAAKRRNTILLVAAMAGVGAGGLATWRAGGFPGRNRSLPSLSVARINAAIGDGIFRATPGMEVRKVDGITVARLGHGKPAVVFTGDSDLFQYGPRVQALLDQGRLDHEVYFVAGPSCPPVPGVRQGGLFSYCAHLPAVLARVIAREHVGTVVMGANWQDYERSYVSVRRDGQRGGRLVAMDQAAGVEEFFANLRDEVGALEAAGHPVYLVLQPVADRLFNPAALIRRSPFGVAVNRAALEGVKVATLKSNDATVNARLRAIAAATGAKVLNPLPDVCGTGPRCPVLFDHGEPKFADGLHMRPGFVRGHITMFDAILTR